MHEYTLASSFKMAAKKANSGSCNLKPIGNLKVSNPAFHLSELKCKTSIRNTPVAYMDNNHAKPMRVNYSYSISGWS